MKSLKRKFNKTFSFATKVMEQIASHVTTGWQYLFSDSNANSVFLTEGNYDSSLRDFKNQNVDKDSNCEIIYHLRDLFLSKEEHYFEQQFVYPSFPHNYRFSVSNKSLFDQNNIQNLELNYLEDSTSKWIEDRNSVRRVKNRNLDGNNELQNTSENNSSFIHKCNNILDNSKLSPVSKLNSAPRNYNVLLHNYVLLKIEGQHLVQKLANNQLLPGNVSLKYKDISFNSKSLADNYFFEDFKLLLESSQLYDSLLKMSMNFRENGDLLQFPHEIISPITENNIVSCQTISLVYNVNKHANDISKYRYTIKCRILHFLKGIFDFVKMMSTKTNSDDLFTFENQILILLRRKELTHFIVYSLRNFSHQEHKNLFFLLFSLLSKITFPNLYACAYHASKKRLFFPKYSELNNLFNLNRHEEVAKIFYPDLHDFDWNMLNLQKSVVFEHINKRRILHETENLNTLKSISNIINQLFLLYNHNSEVKNAEISIVNYSSEISNKLHLTQKCPNNVLNVVFNISKFNNNLHETDVYKRRRKKRKKVSALNNNLKRGNLDIEVKRCQIGNKVIAITNDLILQPTNTENFFQNPITWGFNEYNINICDDTNLEEKSDLAFGVPIEECSQTDSKLKKNLKRKCFDCIVVLKDFKCAESAQNKKLNDNNDSRSEKFLSKISKEENISLRSQCHKRKNNSPSMEKVLSKKVKTGDENGQKNIYLDDQQISGRRRSCRLLNKLKECPLFCVSTSTRSEKNSKMVKKDSFLSKYDENKTLSSNCSEAFSSIVTHKKRSSNPENTSFDSSYPATDDFHLQLCNDKSSIKYSEKSVNKKVNKINKHRDHQADFKKNSQNNKFNPRLDYELKNGKNNLKKGKLIKKKNTDEGKKTAIKKKTPSTVSVLTALNTEKSALIDPQLNTDCDFIGNSIKKYRPININIQKASAYVSSKNINSRKQKVSRTQKSCPFIISSSQSNTFHSTDGNSYFQFSKTVQETYKHPPYSKEKTNFAFNEQVRFIGKKEQAKHSESVFEKKIYDIAEDSLDDLKSMYSPLYNFQNSSSINRSCKRKQNFNEKILKYRKACDSKSVVKPSNDQLLTPKVIDDRMYFVQSGELNIATIDDLCLK